MNEQLFVVFILSLLGIIVVGLLSFLYKNENTRSFSDIMLNESKWNLVQISQREEITRQHLESYCLPQEIIVNRTKEDLKERLLQIISGHIEIEEEIDLHTANIILKGAIKVGIRRK